MTPSAALAFLIFDLTTTLQATATVWGQASRRAFSLYVSFSLVASIASGYVHGLVTGLL